MTPPPIPAEVVDALDVLTAALIIEGESNVEYRRAGGDFQHLYDASNEARTALLSAIARAIAGGRGDDRTMPPIEECEEQFGKWWAAHPLIFQGAAWTVWHAAWNSRAPSKAERDGVLEEAAVACENESISEIGPGDHEYNLAIQHCAGSIREMKGRP